MPGGNRTGPLGAGSGTGRGFGYCAGFEAPGYVRGPGGNFVHWGMGFGRGRGRGFGMGRGGRGWRYAYGPYARPVPDPFYYHAHGEPHPYSYSKQEESEFLRQEARHLEASLKEIKERLAVLEEKEQEQTKSAK